MFPKLEQILCVEALTKVDAKMYIIQKTRKNKNKRSQKKQMAKRKKRG